MEVKYRNCIQHDIVFIVIIQCQVLYITVLLIFTQLGQGRSIYTSTTTDMNKSLVWLCDTDDVSWGFTVITWTIIVDMVYMAKQNVIMWSRIVI